MKRPLMLAVVVLLSMNAVWAKDGPTKDEKAWKALQVRVQSNMMDEESRKLLENFIRSYPQSAYIPEARFAVAELLFSKSLYKEAWPQYKLLADQDDSPYADDAVLRLGEIHYNNGGMISAREYWDKIAGKVLRRGVLSAEALYGLILCDLRDKNYLAANQKLEKLVRQFPVYNGLAKVKELVGIVRFQEKNYHESVAALEDITTPTAEFYRGLSFFHLKQYLEAAEAFKKLTAMTTGTYAEMGAYFKAESFRMADNNNLAAQAYTAFLDAYPKSRLAPYANIHLAHSYFKMKQPQKALSILSSVRQMANVSKEVAAYAVYLESSIWADSKDYGKAISLLDYALNIISKVESPDLFGTIYVAKGYYLLKQGNNKAASDVMTKLVYEMPYHPLGVAACMILGNAAYARNDWNTALTSYETALLKYKYTELSDVALAMLLRTYHQAGRHQELVTNANRVMKLVMAEFPAQNSAWRTYAYFLLAESYYKLKQYQEASAYYQKAMRHNSWVLVSRLYLAWSRYHEENYVDAVALAQKVLMTADNTPEERASAGFLLAASYFNQKKYDEAIDAFKTFRAQFPKSAQVPESYLQEGVACKQARYFKDALAVWASLVKQYPNDPMSYDAQLNIGRLYFEGRQYDKAVRSFAEFMTRWPKLPMSAEAQWLMAQAYYNNKQYAEAIGAYEIFLGRFPKDYRVEDGRRQLMLAYYNRAMATKEPRHLAQFVQMYPKSDLAAEAQYQLGHIAYTSKDWGGAVRELRKLLLNYPGTAQAPTALLAIGHAQEYLKNYDSAVEEYESLLNLFPSSQFALDAAVRLGAIYFDKGKYKEAAVKFAFLVDHNAPKEVKADAEYNIAVSYKRAQSYPDSLQAYERFIKDNENDPRVLDSLLEISAIYTIQEDHQKTVETYQRVLDSNSSKLTSAMRMDIYNQMGDIYLKIVNNKEKAAIAYSQLLVMKPAKHDSRLLGLAQLAAIYEEREEWKKAMRIYEQISISGGRKDWVRTASGRMKEIKDYLRAQKLAQQQQAQAAAQAQQEGQAMEQAQPQQTKKTKNIWYKTGKRAKTGSVAAPSGISNGDKDSGVVVPGK